MMAREDGSAVASLFGWANEKRGTGATIKKRAKER